MTFNLTDYNRLTQPVELYGRAMVLNRTCPIPQSEGIYAWFFRNPPKEIPIDNCVIYNEFVVLYVGIAPKSLASKETLRPRIKKHFKGNAYGSTLRLTLGCLLSTQLGIELRRVSKSRMTFANGEKILDEWLNENALVAYVVRKNPWNVEAQLIQALSLPLNLEYNENHAFYSSLSAIRKRAKENARKLPILR